MQPRRITARIAGRFARQTLSAGEGEVCAVFRRSFYLRVPGERYACIGDASLGKGPLNALVWEFSPPRLGERISIALDGAESWSPLPLSSVPATGGEALGRAAAGRIRDEGLGCLIVGSSNALSVHAQPAIEALDAWLAGNTLSKEAEGLIGLGPGLTPSGDDYLAGMLVALRAFGRPAQADSLWRWLAPRLPGRTGAISAAHLEAASAGEVHEALHACLENLAGGNDGWDEALERIDSVGHCSGWDGLAGAVAVL
jgi:Protein of unknown function (DUF2877)